MSAPGRADAGRSAREAPHPSDSPASSGFRSNRHCRGAIGQGCGAWGAGAAARPDPRPQARHEAGIADRENTGKHGCSEWLCIVFFCRKTRYVRLREQHRDIGELVSSRIRFGFCRCPRGSSCFRTKCAAIQARVYLRGLPRWPPRPGEEDRTAHTCCIRQQNHHPVSARTPRLRMFAGPNRARKFPPSMTCRSSSSSSSGRGGFAVAAGRPPEEQGSRGGSHREQRPPDHH